MGSLSGNYTLLAGSTLWPAQWQDCNCFLRFMAETVGVTTPGDLTSVYLFGHSAGGQLVGVLGLGGNDTFTTNCDHSSTNYTLRGIMAGSAPTDLATLYQESQNSQSDIRNLLGCIPGYQNCDEWAAKASIVNYVAQNLPPYISFSGNLDTGIPPVNVQETSLAFAALNPPVLSTWIELSPDFNHDLDILYYNPCSSDPDGPEPSPCGSAGIMFQDMLTFMKPAAVALVAGNNQTVAAGATAGTALEVNVTDQFGQAVSGATVTFTVNAGTGGASGTFNGAASVQEHTNSNGLATAPPLLVNSLPGTFTVTAAAGNYSASFSETVSASLIPSALTISSGNNQTIGTGTAAPTPLAVVVTNQSGSPLAGVTVTFTANTGTAGAGGTFNGAGTAQAISNSFGIATAPTLTANSSAGTFTVTASTSGLSAVFSVTTTTAPTPSVLTIASGNYQSIGNGLSTGTLLAVSVVDQHGLALPATEVTFTATVGPAGASGTFGGAATAFAVTNANGVATAPALTVNSSSGPFSVTASAGSLSAVFYLNVGNLAPPFGSVDTPVNNSAGIAGAISVNGWALSPIGVQSVAIWRDPTPAEGSSLIYVGSTTIVPGSRPDVAAAHPGYPCNNCGWGAQVLTNELPNTIGQAGIGNGTYTLHLLVTDNSGQVTDIGTTTFGAANRGSILPFGTIDTPTEGETVSGTIVNFGWALTPQPNIIPINGSTIWVFIDGVRLGHPIYDQYRVDIATIFPGLQNSNGAIGYYYIDTTTLSNGLHSIAWTVTDSAGNAQGIGSRYFNVQN
jgi:hypothetical protein